MRRWAKRAAIGAVVALGTAMLLVALALVGANTPPGRELLAWLVPRVTGGQVRVEGLSGAFPAALRARRFALADAAGPWLTARDVVLDWRPLGLLHGEIVVDRLAASEMRLARLPKESEGSAAPSAQPPRPMPVLVHRIDIARFDIAPALAGVPASLAVTGSGQQAVTGTDVVSLDARRLDGGGSYRITARVDPRELMIAARIEEPPHGLLSSLAGLPDLGPIRLDATLAGPRAAVAATIAATAGRLTAHAHGTLDLVHDTADLAVDATAPAMQPRPDIAWESVALHARVTGPFTKPTAVGSLDIARLSAGGAAIARVAASLQGNAGEARLHASLSGIVLPGPAPDLLAAAPLTLEAHARIDAPGRPVLFTIRHPLIDATGEVRTAGNPSLAATIELPDLSPLAALGGVALTGSGSVKVTAAEQREGLALGADGSLRLAGGPAPLFSLLGPAPTFSVAGRVNNAEVALSRLAFAGSFVSLGATGSMIGEKIALDWTASLRDLRQLDANLAGAIAAKGRISGPADALSLAADLTGTLGAPEIPAEPFRAHLAATGLPGAPSADLSAEGTLAGAPLRLALSAAGHPDGVIAVRIRDALWKSAHASGTLALGKGAVPAGRIAFGIGRLADFSPFAGLPLQGSLGGSLSAAESSGVPRLVLDLTGKNLDGGGASVAGARLAATVVDPLADRRLDAKLSLAGIAAGGITGASAELSAAGAESALALGLQAAAPSFGLASLTASALVDATAGTASISALAADWRRASVRLLSPARIAFSDGLAVEHLRLGMAGAELDASGRIRPGLALTAALRNVTPALLAPFAPNLKVKGRLDADASLTGTLAAPAGHLRVRAAGLGLASGVAAGLPPAALDATADLAGRTARVDARLSAGPTTHLALSGTAALAAGGALDLAAKGSIDLALLEPGLAAEGRRIAGRLALDTTVRGTMAAPAIAGSARLTGGTIADFTSGLALTGIAADLEAAGNTVRIARFSAHAGPGTIELAGTIGVFAPTLPIALTITARNAELLQSDRITVWLDSDLTINGSATDHLAAAGTVHVRRAEIRIPDRMPANIPVLNVVRAGSPPPPPAPPGPNVGLDITIVAPREVFVRGRGVDAEFGGRIHLSGTAASPMPEGSFNLVRGQVSLAGQVLTFTSGTIGFNGGDATDPTLNIVATTSNGGTTATLAIGGTAQKPTVTLSSSPQLPQDQVLSQLLFGRSATTLSPFQLASIANALTTLTGVGPSVGDPLDTIRKGLGLDRLTVGSSANGSPTLKAGRYLAPGVYLGANQSTAGAGTQAEVQIDLTKRLKLNATVGTGSGSATGANTPNGTTVGLSYQFQY
jgi:translocation and assembly module TamB